MTPSQIDKKLRNKGCLATITQGTNPEDYDAIAGRFLAGASSQSLSVPIIFDSFTQKDLDRFAVLQGDVKILASALSEIKKGSILTFGSERYRIHDLDVIRPAGINLMYILQGRQ